MDYYEIREVGIRLPEKRVLRLIHDHYSAIHRLFRLWCHHRNYLYPTRLIELNIEYDPSNQLTYYVYTTRYGRKGV